MSERDQMALINAFKEEIKTPGFISLLQEVKTKYGLFNLYPNLEHDIGIDKEMGKPYLAIDIAPGGLTDTDNVKRIIREVKPRVITFRRFQGDDWGINETWEIPTDHLGIKLRAHIYVSDWSGGVWSNSGDPSSDNYKEIKDYPSADTGKYELLK